MNIFEKASKLKLRFNTTIGMLSTEELWDLKLDSLDRLAVDYQDEINSVSSASFINADKKPSENLQLSFDICKSIIESRLKIIAIQKAASEKSAKIESILSDIADKEKDEQKNKSLDELKELLAEAQAS